MKNRSTQTFSRSIKASAALLALAWLTSANATSDDMIYDNLPDELPGFNTSFGEAPTYLNAGPPWYVDNQPYRTQPFVTGDFGRVSSVHVYIINNGARRGALKLWLLEDDSGDPGETIAEIGAIELASLPDWNQQSNDIGAVITLEPNIAGLEPNTHYHIGFDQHTMPDPARYPDPSEATYYNLYNTAATGTRGARPSIVNPFDEWERLDDWVEGANYMLMRISQKAPEPPAPAESVTLEKTTGATTISWQGIPGTSYTVRYRESLAQGDWETAQVVTSDTPQHVFQDTDPARTARTQGYYQVVTVSP